MFKKGLSLIELIIVIAIILIMTVLAVPAFDKYGNKVALEGKAEEIKAAIEKAYQEAKTPAYGKNGSRVILNTSLNTINTSTADYPDGPCAKLEGKISDCLPSNANTTASVSIPDSDFEIRNMAINSLGGSYSTNNLTIHFDTPAEEKDVIVYYTDGNSEVNFESVFFELHSKKSDAYYYTITIKKYPFSVEIKRI